MKITLTLDGSPRLLQAFLCAGILSAHAEFPHMSHRKLFNRMDKALKTLSQEGVADLQDRAVTDLQTLISECLAPRRGRGPQRACDGPSRGGPA